MSHLFVPAFEGLTVDTMLKEAAKYPVVFEYIPDSKDIPRLPRQWLANVLNTVVGQDFADWVHRKIELRNEGRARDKNLMIDLDPEVARAFQASTHVSAR